MTALCWFSYSITPPPAPTHYDSCQPWLIPSAVLAAPTQPFSGLCHLIHLEDDSRSAIWGAGAAEESLPRPSTSIIQLSRCRPPPPFPPSPFSPLPPVPFLSLLLLLLLTTVCTPAQHPQPEVSVVCKSPIWNSTASCRGKVTAELSAT